MMDPQVDKNKFLESVAECACTFFSKLPNGAKPRTEKSEWTTMAAIVQSTGQDLQVVSLGTGTKCIGKNELSPLGDVLSDSHAEVVCRRSFLLYLYDQLSLKLSWKESIFENDGSTLNLRPGIAFHLFVSHTPCGDAAIFNLPPADASDDEAKEPPTKKNKVVDQEDCSKSGVSIFRTGAKLNVTDSVYEDVQILGKCRVKPGKGDPTLSMSCSDKIAKWQIMGLQGSLLGNFVKNPIVFQSIAVGGSVAFESTSLKRALYERFSSNQELDEIILRSPFKSHRCLPEIYQSRVNYPNFTAGSGDSARPAPSSISSYKRDTVRDYCMEVSVNGRKQGVTKKNLGKSIARVAICRLNILQQFVQLCKKYEERFKISIVPQEKTNLTYREAKAVNSVYNDTWNSVKDTVMIGWTTKPENMENFHL